MEYQNEKCALLKKSFDDRLKKERTQEKLALVQLKDVPLEVRRNEAKKPLFLTRYE